MIDRRPPNVEVVVVIKCRIRMINFDIDSSNVVCYRDFLVSCDLDKPKLTYYMLLTIWPVLNKTRNEYNLWKYNNG